METMAIRRKLALAAFGVVGTVSAFAMGAKLGNELDHQTRAVSVAKVSVTELQAAAGSAQDAPAPNLKQTPVGPVAPVARVTEGE